MGAIVYVGEENWREKAESLEFAVLEAATVERATNVNLGMKRGRGGRKNVVGKMEAIYQIGLR